MCLNVTSPEEACLRSQGKVGSSYLSWWHCGFSSWHCPMAPHVQRVPGRQGAPSQSRTDAWTKDTVFCSSDVMRNDSEALVSSPATCQLRELSDDPDFSASTAPLHNGRSAHWPRSRQCSQPSLCLQAGACRGAQAAGGDTGEAQRKCMRGWQYREPQTPLTHVIKTVLVVTF